MIPHHLTALLQRTKSYEGMMLKGWIGLGIQRGCMRFGLQRTNHFLLLAYIEEMKLLTDVSVSK